MVWLVFSAIPDYPGLGYHHLFKGPDMFFGLDLLDVADEGVQQQHRRDHPSVFVFLQKGGHHRGNQENIYQGALELVEQDFQPADLFLFRQFVGSEFLQALFDFGFGQAVLGSVQVRKNLVNFTLIPVHPPSIINTG
jgi:hypothetical protein